MFVEKQTQSGQDLFIRGGVSQPSLSNVPISVRRLPDQWSLYNDWSTGDHSLDWDGAESGQGTHNGQEALGTPLGWTSSNPGNQFHHELNSQSVQHSMSVPDNSSLKHRCLLFQFNRHSRSLCFVTLLL